jgi:hypothetical protein
MPRKPLPVTRTPPAKPPPKPRTPRKIPPPAPLDNTRTVTHGAGSPKLVAPLREQHLKALRADYPDLDERRMTLLADRLARIDLASEWIERQKSIALNKRGDVSSIVVLIDKWTSAVERALKEAEAARKKAPRYDLALAMSALSEAEDADALDETLDT